MTCKNHRDLIHGLEFSHWELWSLNRSFGLEYWEDWGDQYPGIDGMEFDLVKPNNLELMEWSFDLAKTQWRLRCKQWTLTWEELNDLKFMEWEATWQFVINGPDIDGMDFHLAKTKMDGMKFDLAICQWPEIWWNGIEVLGVRLGKDSCPTAFNQETRHKICLV